RGGDEDAHRACGRGAWKRSDDRRLRGGEAGAQEEPRSRKQAQEQRAVHASNSPAGGPGGWRSLALRVHPCAGPQAGATRRAIQLGGWYAHEMLMAERRPSTTGSAAARPPSRSTMLPLHARVESEMSQM